MECLETRAWNKYAKEELLAMKIEGPDEDIRRQVLKNWDRIAKPLDGLGRFELLFAQIGAVTRSAQIDISRKAVIIMCADNGIVEEGVSQSGQEVTAAVAKEMAEKQSSVGKMAEVIGADTFPVDIGINCGEPLEGLIQKKVRYGTRNFRKEPAMTEEETIKAVFAGIEVAEICKSKGYQLLATGEMGIGNTTTSTAVAAALLGCDAEEITGRGAGLDDKGLKIKKRVINEAIARYGLKQADAMTVLMTVGGLDIAGLVGVCIGSALFHLPVVLDGVISLTAALLAERLLPGTKSCFIASHKGKEQACAKLIEELDLHPVIEADLALGEGTGAVMMMGLLDMAAAVYNDRTTFGDIRIEQYKRY